MIHAVLRPETYYSNYVLRKPLYAVTVAECIQGKYYYNEMKLNLFTSIKHVYIYITIYFGITALYSRVQNN